MSFTARLQSGHSLSGMRSADILKLLQDDMRVCGAIPSSLADRREWAAALAWADLNKPILLADVQALTKQEHDLLALVLDIGSGKRPSVLCPLILTALSADGGDLDSGSDVSTFVDLLEKHDKDLSTRIKSLTKPKLQETLKDAPACFSAGAVTVAELRNRYSFLQWASVAGTPDDFKSLSPQLRQTAFQILNVPSASLEVQCQMAALLSGKTLFQHRQHTIPPHVEISGNDVSGGAEDSDRVGGGAGAGPFPSAADGPRGRLHFSDASPPCNGQQRLGGQSAWDHPLVDYGSFAPGSHARADLESARAKYVSMKTSWTNLISKEELKAVREAMKLTQDSQESISLSRQYCPWPWGQRLTIDTSQSFKPSRQGRILMNALRMDNENFNSWTELQLRNFRETEHEAVVAMIDSAIASGDVSSLLLAFSELRDFAQKRFTAEVANSATLFQKLTFKEFQEIHQGRSLQMHTCPAFFDSISRRIRSEAKKHSAEGENECLIGAYISFFSSWKAGDLAQEDANELKRLGKKFSTLGSSTGSSNVSSSPKANRAVSLSSFGAGRISPGSPSSNRGAKSRSPAASSSGASVPRYRTGISLPSSESIIGPHLGISSPPFSCHFCRDSGHWKGECPAFWGSRDTPLPGWKKDGKKDKKAWEGENPKKETFKLWVQFIKDNFEDGGEPAGLEGAPSFSDYKDRARKGAGP